MYYNQANLTNQRKFTQLLCYRDQRRVVFSSAFRGQLWLPMKRGRALHLQHCILLWHERGNQLLHIGFQGGSWEQDSANQYRQHARTMNTVPTRVHSVVAYAVLSRLALLAIFLVSTLVISSLPYDTSTTLTLRGSTANVASSELGIPIQNGWKASPFGKVLSRLVSWDALYFTTIAEEGYLWEHWHAFFPGFPSAMKLLATSTPACTYF